MVRRRVGQGIGISRQDLVSDGGQSFAEDLTNIRMPPGAPDNASDRIRVNIADRQLVQIGGEAATRLHFPLGVDDQRLPGTFAIIFLKPAAVPRAGSGNSRNHLWDPPRHSYLFP